MKVLRAALALWGIATAALALASPAVAGFTSHTKSSKGKGETVETIISAGGATVTCHAYGEATSEAAWTVKSEGKAAEKGPNLVINFEKWGECTASYGEVKNGEVKMSSCELEVAQAGEEAEVTGKFITTCTMTVPSCEIKIAPSENEKLKGITLATSGTKAESTMLEATVKNLATTTKGTCTGIKGSKEGKLTANIEAKQVQPALSSEFAIGASRLRLTAANNTSTVTIIRIAGATAALTGFSELLAGTATLTKQEPARKECKEMIYEVTKSCSYQITYGGAETGLVYTRVWGANLLGAGVEVSATP